MELGLNHVRQSNRVKQQGISLLEVLLSLSIIAIILVMATRYFFIASNNNKINTAREQIGSVIEAVHSWKGQNPTYSSGTLTIGNLIEQGYLTLSSSVEQAADGNSTLYGPWGQAIQLTAPAAPGDPVTVSLTTPSQNDCDRLASSFAYTSASNKPQCGGNDNATLSLKFT